VIAKDLKRLKQPGEEKAKPWAEEPPGMGQQVKMTCVRVTICEPQTEAKHSSNTFFNVLNALPISKLTSHHLNATTATTSENLSANLNPGKIYTCHDCHLWEYSG